MDFSALCSNQFSCHKQLGQLREIIEECESMVRIMAERKGLELIV